jgi:hypothetical protein
MTRVWVLKGSKTYLIAGQFYEQGLVWLRWVEIPGLGLARFMDWARVKLRRVSIPGLELARFMNRLWVR